MTDVDVKTFVRALEREQEKEHGTGHHTYLKLRVPLIDAIRIIANHDEYSDELVDGIIAAMTGHISDIESSNASLREEIERLNETLRDKMPVEQASA